MVDPFLEILVVGLVAGRKIAGVRIRLLRNRFRDAVLVDITRRVVGMGEHLLVVKGYRCCSGWV